jgi:hypothetical protein
VANGTLHLVDRTHVDDHADHAVADRRRADPTVDAAPTATGTGTGTLLGLQRRAGNRAVTDLVARLPVQRHAPGTALPDKEQLANEVQASATAPGAATTTAPPEATRAADVATKEKGDATTAGTDFVKDTKASPKAMSLAGAEKVLQGAYGDLKKIVPGRIEILADQPACSRKYDEVCIADKIKRPDGSDWKIGDTAKDDAAAGVQTVGFQWKGVVYVNGKRSLITATAHEVLHNNVAAGFRSKVGETFNEGCTESLARLALTAAGITVPATTAYPDQVAMTTKLIALVTSDVVQAAYFGGADSLIEAYEKKKGAGKFAALKTAADALDTAKTDPLLTA